MGDQKEDQDERQIATSDIDSEKNGHVNPLDVLSDEKPVPEVVIVNGTTQGTGEKPGAAALSTDDEVEQRRQERRDKDPLKICKFICERPKLAFGLALVGQISFILITVILLRVGYDIIPITFDRIPLDIGDDPDFLRESAWNGRFDNDALIDWVQSDVASTTQAERTEITEIMEFIFHLPDGGNILTKKNLQKIKEVEEEFTSNQEYQEKFCHVDSFGACKKTNSILRYFDGTYAGINAVFNDPGFDNIAAVMHAANTASMINVRFQYYLAKNAKITAQSANMDSTRSTISLGGPLAGYANTSIEGDEQNDKVKRFILDTFKPIGDKYFEKGAGDMQFVFSSGNLISVTITGLVLQDMLLVVGSLIFIIIFMFIQTGSFWVTLWAVFSIISCFTCANIIYRCILDYRYFGAFHVLALFIILGIGADDIFVFFDTWKETGHHKYKSLAHRMSDCYKKASMAMLFTSLTTAQAFIVSATSPFLGVSSFGVFAGLLVFVNYVSVIVFFPTVVVTYHLGFEKYKCCCCCVKAGHGVDSEQPTDQAPDDGRRKNKIVQFFRGRYFNFVTHKIGRWFILAFFAVMLAVFIYFASSLKVNEEQIKFLKDSSNIGRYLSLSTEAFNSRGGERGGTEVQLVWGLEKQDFSDCHHTDVSCTGKTVWDDSFNLNGANAQQKLLDLCRKIKNLPDDKIDELRINRDLNTRVPEVDCFIQDMKTFMQEKSYNVPMSAADATSIMNSHPSIYNQPLPAGFSNHFEIGMSYWLYNGFSFGGPSASQMTDYGSVLGQASQAATRHTNIPIPGGGSFKFSYGTRLRFAAITVNTTVKYAVGYPEGLPIRDAWEDFMQTEVEALPEPLKGGFQCTGDGLWHWLRIQETLTSSAVIGIAIGLCVAFPILIIATHNVIIGILATLTICCITVCVIGVIPMAGWKLGLLESLNLVLVVGLAVDYVVHLAEGYSRSMHNDRLGRTRDMLEEVGISVLSGACTTLGASLFMLFAQILFFTEFGVFMFSTILFSIVFALGLFVTVMALIGPQNEVGSLKPFYRWCKKTCCKKVEPHPN